MDSIKLVWESLQALAQLSGFHVVWKREKDNAWKTLSQTSYQHCNKCCNCVKSVPWRLRKCIEEDCLNVFVQAQQEKKPFIRTCHAGITELVFPLFVEGAYDSMIFLGPVRLKDTCGIYADVEKFYAELPVFDEDKFTACLKVLKGLATDFTLKLKAPEVTTGDPRIEKACTIIATELGKKLRAPEIAERCYLSTSRFLHLFSEHMKISFSTYVTQQRLQRACFLLSKTMLPIHTIAGECGYPNANYLSALFRRKNGMSPGQYRKENYQELQP